MLVKQSSPTSKPHQNHIKTTSKPRQNHIKTTFRIFVFQKLGATWDHRIGPPRSLHDHDALQAAPRWFLFIERREPRAAVVWVGILCWWIFWWICWVNFVVNFCCASILLENYVAKGRGDSDRCWNRTWCLARCCWIFLFDLVVKKKNFGIWIPTCLVMLLYGQFLWFFHVFSTSNIESSDLRQPVACRKQ